MTTFLSRKWPTTQTPKLKIDGFGFQQIIVLHANLKVASIHRYEVVMFQLLIFLKLGVGNCSIEMLSESNGNHAPTREHVETLGFL